MADVKFARLVGGYVQEVIKFDPNGVFHPDVAKEYISCPLEVEQGWELVGEQWVTPPAPPVPPQTIPIIGPIAFQLLFTMGELIAIEAAKEQHPEVRIFWKLLDDPRTDRVDRNLDSVKAGIYTLENLGLIAQGRAQEILYGEVTK